LPDNEERRKRIASAIRQVLDGDSEQYKAIHDLTDASLRSYIGSRRRNSDPQLIDEISSLTHQYSLKRLAEYDEAESASYQTWLNNNSRSATAVVMREWYGDRLVGFSEADHEDLAPSVPGPEDLRERAECDRVLAEEFASLAEPGRSCMQLCDIDGLSVRDAGAQLKISASGVCRYLHRAREELREKVEKRGIRPTEVAPSAEPVWPRYRRKDDDETRTTVTAVLPFEPGDLVGAIPIPTEEEETE
jgi:RNA polymerase sigma factor (sigma-70 family)